MEKEKLKIRKGGFTLMEIMVIIGIMIILTSTSWVAIASYQPTMTLNAASRDLVSDLRLAQQLSVSEQINHGVFINTITKQYQLDRFSAVTETLFLKNLPSSISFCGINGLVNDYVIFNPYGSVIMAGSICLSNIKGQTKNIEIKPSGFVKIQN